MRKKLLTNLLNSSALLYLVYLLLPLPHFKFDVYVVKALTSILGSSWRLIPLYMMANMVFRQGLRYLLLLACMLPLNIVLYKAYTLSGLDESAHYIRPILFSYIFPLLLTIFLSFHLYRGKKGRTIKYLLALSGGSLLFILLSHYSLPGGSEQILKRIISLIPTEGIASLIAMPLVTILGIVPSMILSLAATSFLLFLYVKANIPLKKPKIVMPKVKRAPEKVVNELEQIFRTQDGEDDVLAKVRKLAQAKVPLLEEMLKEHGVEAKVINTVTGPSVTRFELSVARGTKVKKVSALNGDIAMNLAAQTVRIEAPIPGKNARGGEIPNDVMSQVYFGSIIRKKNMRNHLQVVLGKNIVGEDILVDLRKMPHLLVAGRTGSGKSVGINVIIASILYTASPEDVKFIMIDPKMVELMPYNGIPHLYVPVITDPKLAANALNWAVEEMEKRYKLLAESGVRHLDNYNQKTKEQLPYLVIIIDELADLMMVAPASIETSIARIAQKARAVGIHLVIATQRPSIDVITGTIKANLPSRIAFSVASQIDSRTILDGQGAEQLLGRGDMLFSESGKSSLMRIQGAYISDDEVIKFASYLRSKGKANYKNEILSARENADRDALYERALEIIREQGKASTTLVQRKLAIGYSRAARIMDQLEEAGIVIVKDNGEKELVEDQ